MIGWRALASTTGSIGIGPGITARGLFARGRLAGSGITAIMFVLLGHIFKPGLI
jgi:hypothetical protein